MSNADACGKQVRCPFYRAVEKDGIRCEGPRPAAGLKVLLRRKKALLLWQRSLCEEEPESCPVFSGLMAACYLTRTAEEALYGACESGAEEV